jgi:hypothetical protein
MALLFGVLETCPRCKQPASFGRCWITAKGLLFKCNKCGHQEAKDLPPIKKPILYIDQFALSKMVKNRDQEFWGELYGRLVRLTASDIITCPFSPVHVRESKFSHRLRDSLKKMYRQIAGDNQFRSQEDIEKRQLARALRANLGCKDSKPTEVCEDDAFERSPHRWSDIVNVYVDFPYNEELIAGLKAAKESFHLSMQAMCERWRANPVAFDEQVELEASAFRATVQLYRQQTGGNPDRYGWFGSLLELDVVDWLVSTVQAIAPDETNPLDVVERFANSQQFRDTPCIYLRTRIWAKIAELVLNPKGPRKPRASDGYDASVLASYAPYCQAMLIDGGFREIAIDSRIDVEQRFGTKVFSEQNKDAFLCYLDELERAVPHEHWRNLAFIRGLTPPQMPAVK